MLVIIPHLPFAQQGHELRLAIEGWKQHFKHPHPFRIVVVGEGLPRISGVTCVESKRVPPKIGQYRQHLDYVSCVRKVYELYPDGRGFITAADDVFAVNDFTLNDVKKPKIQELEMPLDWDTDNPWRWDLAKTATACKIYGLGMFNWTTHLPHYYEWKRLFEIYDRFDCDNESHVVENLYYNWFYKFSQPYLLHLNDPWKFEVSYRPLDREGLHNAFARKKWVTCTENGWSPEMEVALARHYGINL